jgi:chlorophyll synthase
MAIPQAAVIGLLLFWDKPLHALGVAAMLAIQIAAMRVLLRDPEGKTPWYQGMGILFYISGMMIAATALRSVGV